MIVTSTPLLTVVVVYAEDVVLTFPPFDLLGWARGEGEEDEDRDVEEDAGGEGVLLVDDGVEDDKGVEGVGELDLKQE